MKFKTINDKIFTLVDSIGNTNYKFVNFPQGDFLVIEQVIKEKGLFKKRALTTELKYLPLNAFILRLFVKQAQMKLIGEDEKSWGLEKERIFETVNIVELRKEFKELTKRFEKSKYPYRFDLETESPELLGLLRNKQFLYSEGLGYSRTVWLAKSLDRGHLILNACLLQGRGTEEELLAMDTYVIGIETITKVMNHIAKIRPDTKEEE